MDLIIGDLTHSDSQYLKQIRDACLSKTSKTSVGLLKDWMNKNNTQSYYFYMMPRSGKDLLILLVVKDLKFYSREITIILPKGLKNIKKLIHQAKEQLATNFIMKC